LIQIFSDCIKRKHHHHHLIIRGMGREGD